MFGNEKTQRTPLLNDRDIVVAAQPGFAVFFFNPLETAKASALESTQLLASNLHAVTCWRVRGNITEPLTAIAPKTFVARYLFTASGRIVALDDEAHPSWGDREQWQVFLLAMWQQMRGSKEPAMRPPSPLVMKPGETAVIHRH